MPVQTSASPESGLAAEDPVPPVAGNVPAVAKRGVTRWRTAGMAAVLLVLLGVGAWALFRPATGEGDGVARVGSSAPAVSLSGLDGRTLTLADQRGKVVLLNFWATWCVPCRSEMPALEQLHQDLASAPFTLYAINLQEDAPQIEPFTRELSLSLPILLDTEGDVTRRYGVRALPATFLVDQRGVLRQQHLGPLTEGAATTPWTRDWLAAQVRTLLAEQG